MNWFRPAAACAICILCPTALAAPGDLDPTFGAHGLFTAPAVTELIPLVEPDGRIIVATSLATGHGPVSGQRDIHVRRLLANGTPDPSFGGASGTFVDFDGRADFPGGMTRQADGRIIVVGWSGPSVKDVDLLDFVVVRLNVDGTLDTTFSGDGKTVVDFGTDFEGALSVTVQPDGKIVVAGFAFNPDPAPVKASTDTRIAFARLHTDGSFDGTFGTNGLALITAGITARPRTVGIDQHGRIIAAGRGQAVLPGTSPRGVQTYVAVSLEGDGTPTPGFGTDGVVLGAFPMTATSARVLTDGKLVVAGSANSGSADSIVVRLGANGLPDASWAAGTGVAAADISDMVPSSTGNDVVYDVDVDASGRVLIAGAVATPRAVGEVITSAETIAFVARFASDGVALDPTFGLGGAMQVDAANRAARIAAPTRASEVRLFDGRVIVGGVAGGSGFLARLVDATGESAGLLGLVPHASDPSEAAGNVTFRVSRTGGASGAATIDYAVVAATASAGADFGAVTGTLSWAAGDAADKPIDVGLVDDLAAEDTETFRIMLMNPMGGAGISVSSVTVGIVDDDAPATTFPIDVTVQRVHEADPAPFIFIRRTDGGTGDITLNYTFRGGTATQDVDFALFAGNAGQIILQDGSTASRSIQLLVIDDGHVEPDETILLDIEAVLPNATTVNGTVTMTISDDDTRSLPGQIAFTQSAAVVAENAATIALTARRSNGADGSVSATYAVTGGTATAGADFTLASGTVSWADGEVADKTITVTIANDSVDEPDETLVLTLSAPTGGATLGAQTEATVTITDDDPPPAPPTPPANSGGGGGGSGALTLDLLALLLCAASVPAARRQLLRKRTRLARG
jgi:uncharacterized delta-60 repeat protein